MVGGAAINVQTAAPGAHGPRHKCSLALLPIPGKVAEGHTSYCTSGPKLGNSI